MQSLPVGLAFRMWDLDLSGRGNGREDTRVAFGIFGDNGRKGGDLERNAGIATRGDVSRITGIAWYSGGSKRPSQAWRPRLFSAAQHPLPLLPDFSARWCTAWWPAIRGAQNMYMLGGTMRR